MDAASIRAWWAHRQGLDGTLDRATPAQVLERSGWARSVGGVGPYLALFARAGTSREEADAAVAALDIHELPSARGCTYVVPASEFALALKVASAFGDSEMRVGETLGVTEKEVELLGDAVVAAVRDQPRSPDELRAAVGDAARSLGDAGKKKGLSTTLPLALGRLQTAGRIRRVPTNGRLDQQRYRYVAWTPNPLAGLRMTLDQAFTELARRYFRWVGPATLAQFQWFSGLGAKAAQTAIKPLALVPVAAGDDRLLHADELAAFRAFKAPTEPRFALVGSLDSMHAHRRDVRSLLDPKDVDRKVPGERGAVAAGSLSDLPSHAILDRGRLVGLWEYDPADCRLAWAAFVPRSGALEGAVGRVEAFVRDQLGDARSFSLDSPKSRAPRVEALRKAR